MRSLYVSSNPLTTGTRKKGFGAKMFTTKNKKKTLKTQVFINVFW